MSPAARQKYELDCKMNPAKAVSDPLKGARTRPKSESDALLKVFDEINADVPDEEKPARTDIDRDILTTQDDREEWQNEQVVDLMMQDEVVLTSGLIGLTNQGLQEYLLWNLARSLRITMLGLKEGGSLVIVWGSSPFHEVLFFLRNMLEPHFRETSLLAAPFPSMETLLVCNGYDCTLDTIDPLIYFLSRQHRALGLDDILMWSCKNIAEVHEEFDKHKEEWEDLYTDTMKKIVRFGKYIEEYEREKLYQQIDQERERRIRELRGTTPSEKTATSTDKEKKKDEDRLLRHSGPAAAKKRPKKKPLPDVTAFPKKDEKEEQQVVDSDFKRKRKKGGEDDEEKEEGEETVWDKLFNDSKRIEFMLADLQKEAEKSVKDMVKTEFRSQKLAWLYPNPHPEWKRAWAQNTGDHKYNEGDPDIPEDFRTTVGFKREVNLATTLGIAKLDRFLDDAMDKEVKKHADPDRTVTREEIVALMMQQKDYLRDSGSYNVRLVQDAYAQKKQEEIEEARRKRLAKQNQETEDED